MWICLYYISPFVNWKSVFLLESSIFEDQTINLIILYFYWNQIFLKINLFSDLFFLYVLCIFTELKYFWTLIYLLTRTFFIYILYFYRTQVFLKIDLLSDLFFLYLFSVFLLNPSIFEDWFYFIFYIFTELKYF